jgi:hypothetical protein
MDGRRPVARGGAAGGHEDGAGALEELSVDVITLRQAELEAAGAARAAFAAVVGETGRRTDGDVLRRAEEAAQARAKATVHELLARLMPGVCLQWKLWPGALTLQGDLES